MSLSWAEALWLEEVLLPCGVPQPELELELVESSAPLNNAVIFQLVVRPATSYKTIRDELHLQN